MGGEKCGLSTGCTGAKTMIRWREKKAFHLPFVIHRPPALLSPIQLKMPSVLSSCSARPSVSPRASASPKLFASPDIASKLYSAQAPASPKAYASSEIVCFFESCFLLPRPPLALAVSSLDTSSRPNLASSLPITFLSSGFIAFSFANRLASHLPSGRRCLLFLNSFFPYPISCT